MVDIAKTAMNLPKIFLLKPSLLIFKMAINRQAVIAKLITGAHIFEFPDINEADMKRAYQTSNLDETLAPEKCL